MSVRELPSAAFLLVLFMPLISTAQDIWYVDDDGDTENGCTSWDDACPELQTALSLAEAGHQIWVAVGTYKPDYDVDTEQHTGDREATFQLINGVAIYGGFDGTEATLDERAGLFDQTILTGDLSGDDVPVECVRDFPDCSSFGGLCVNGTCIISNNNDDNSYHVTTGSGTDATALLNGFTIKDGNANGSSPHHSGGGMYNAGGSPTLTNCTFSTNVAFLGGGGMYNGSDSSPTVTDCTFSTNVAFLGGGMFNHESSPMVISCTFSGNVTFLLCLPHFCFGGGGAGMYNSNSSPMVTNCTFGGNTTYSGGGGGMYNSDYSSPTVTDCTFSTNDAYAGGGMCNDSDSSPTVTDCTFSTNDAILGGGMGNREGSPMVINCTFSGNEAHFGGGMYNREGSPTVINCTFSENEARRGGGMFVNASNPTVINCTFSANTASLEGGGMFNHNSSPAVTNCTFIENDADNGRALAFDSLYPHPSDLSMSNCILWDGGGEVWNNDNSSISIAYSDVQGGWPGEGNIELDPLFSNPDSGDFHLSAGSPCIDAADNTAVPEGIVTDLDGNPRFVDDPNIDDTGFGDPPIVDMGAYEFQDPCADDDGDGRVTICHIPPGNPDNAHTITVNVNAVPAHLGHGDDCGPCGEDDGLLLIASESEVCSADVNGDGVVSAADLALLLGNWGPNPRHRANFDDDGVVGAADLAVLLGSWGSCE